MKFMHSSNYYRPLLQLDSFINQTEMLFIRINLLKSQVCGVRCVCLYMCAFILVL